MEARNIGECNLRQVLSVGPSVDLREWVGVECGLSMVGPRLPQSSDLFSILTLGQEMKMSCDNWYVFVE